MAGYKRHSSPVPDSSPFLKSPVNDPVDDDCHMPEPQRPPLDQRPLPVNQSLQPRSKRQKLSHPSGSQPPAAFWDNLSQLWLTKRALRELDRRNAAPNLSYGRPPGPITRRARDEPTQSVADFLCQCGPTCLTDIEQFARHGGPDLSDLRGYPERTDLNNHMMGSNKSSARSRKRKQEVTSASDAQPITNTTKSTGPYDRAFQQNLIDGGVFPFAYEYPDGRVPAEPNNQEEIKQKLAQPRSSLSPSKFSEETHKKFVRADAHASKERQVTTSVIPIIEGEIRDAKCVSGGIPFTNLDHLTDGTLVPGNPDLYYGARPEQLNRRIRDELSGQIIPSKQYDLPITPNFFLAAKGPDGSSAVAGRQACYDGALGARGMHSLQSYGEDKPVYDNKAYTITSIYHGGQLKLYTSHPSQRSPGGRPEYCMTQLGAYSMTHNREAFCLGASAYRNARDWTKEQRDEAIRRANERADDSQLGVLAFDASFDELSGFSSDASPDETHNTEALGQESQTSLNKDSNTTADPPEPETSTDELSLDHNIPAKRLRRHSKRSHQPQQN